MYTCTCTRLSNQMICGSQMIRVVSKITKNINKIDTLRSSQNVCIWQYIEEKDYNVTSCEPQRDIKIYIQCKEARICKSNNCNVILKKGKKSCSKTATRQISCEDWFFLNEKSSIIYQFNSFIHSNHLKTMVHEIHN